MAEWHLNVDEHGFLVRDRPAEPGVYDFDWLTGPQSYGFTSGSYDRAAMNTAEMRESISDFLARVDPQTGYLE